MLKNYHRLFTCIYSLFFLLLLAGCNFSHANEIIVNRYADVLLTRDNELQFRFRINNAMLIGHDLYKVRVSIHDKKLISALGKRVIIYGEDQVLNGEYLETKENHRNYIFMDPIPMKMDLHIQELQKLIEKENAVSIEIFNDKQVFGRSFLTNFSSEL